MTETASDERMESFTTADGVTLRATLVATGRRRVVLVSPGIFLHRDSVEHRALARRLARVADVVTLDIRGHGDSGGAFKGILECQGTEALQERVVPGDRTWHRR